eukprot:9396264-Pyramimonas_sp.AAC.2
MSSHTSICNIMKALQTGHQDEVEVQYTARHTQATQEARRRQLMATTAKRQSNTQKAQVVSRIRLDELG